jgi:serine/threonine-protein kinase
MEFIAKGGMGEVYRAHQLNLKRDVAIKVISQELLESFDGDTEEIGSTLERFNSEVKAMAQIRHANILQIYDFGSASIQKKGEEINVEYIAMEYIPGATLRSTMSEEGFGADEELIHRWLSKYFLPLLDGVRAIHEHGVVHRDLKPENVLMDEDTPKIADFGLARSNRLAPVTRSIDVKGSPAYMSPEHFFEFGKAGQPADVYSLGKILYEAVTGKITPKTIPFKRAHLPQTDTLFLQELDQIIQKATSEDVADRFKSVTKLHDVLLDALRLLKDSDTAAPRVPVPSSISVLPKWVFAAITVAIISVVSISAVHLSDPAVTPVTPAASSKECLSPDAVASKVEPLHAPENSKSLSGTSESRAIKLSGYPGSGTASGEVCW